MENNAIGVNNAFAVYLPFQADLCQTADKAYSKTDGRCGACIVVKIRRRRISDCSLNGSIVTVIEVKTSS